MPELPEVETVVRSLQDNVLDKCVVGVQVLHAKSFPDVSSLDFVLQQKICGLRRRAKLILFDLANNYHLVVHLKMTGQLLYKSGHQLAGGGHPTAAECTIKTGKITFLNVLTRVTEVLSEMCALDKFASENKLNDEQKARAAKLGLEYLN